MCEIVVERLFCRRGEFFLRVGDLCIPRGAKVAVLGENGSGKSTFLLTLAGLIPFEGAILYGGRDVGSFNTFERAKVVSYMPQNPIVSFGYTVFEVVLMGRYPWMMGGVPEGRDMELTRKALELFELGHLSRRRFQHLSGGEQRRVILARTYNQRAAVMLLDEPFSMLDVRYALKAADILLDTDATVLAVMHDINMALSLFTDTILMREGEVVYYGSSKDVSEDMLSSIYRVDFRRGSAFLPAGGGAFSCCS